LHSNAGSGHRAQGAHGGHGFGRGQDAASGHLGHTGGTICDFNIYSSLLLGGGGDGGGGGGGEGFGGGGAEDSSIGIAVDVGTPLVLLGGGLLSLYATELGVVLT